MSKITTLTNAVSRFSLKTEPRELSGSPVVRAPSSHCRGQGYSLWSGNYFTACHTARKKGRSTSRNASDTHTYIHTHKCTHTSTHHRKSTHSSHLYILFSSYSDTLFFLLQFKAFLSIDGSMVFCACMCACACVCVCVCVLAQLCLTPAIP